VLAAAGLSAVRFQAVTRGLTAKLSGATGTSILRLLAVGLSLKQLLTEGLLPMVKLLAAGGLSCVERVADARDAALPRDDREKEQVLAEVPPIGAFIAIIYVLCPISLFVYVMVRGYE
jgi:hypothetical protein